MRKVLLLLPLLLVGALYAQNREINFEHGSLNEALAKAKTTGKPLFFDAYTSWCGPCKQMAKEVFTLDRVADYFNANFICLKMDTEKGEGPNIVEKYNINVYPTFLILDGEGNEIFRLVGGADADVFIRKIAEGIQPENSLLALEKKFEQGARDAAFIDKYCATLIKGHKLEKVQHVTELYFKDKSVQELCTKENWALYDKYVQDINSPLYHLMIEHVGEFKKLIGQKIIEDKLNGAYAQVIFSSIPNTSLTEEELQQYAEDIKQMDLQNKESLFYLNSYLQLARLKAEKRYDEILNYCEAGPLDYSPERKSTLIMCLVFLADGTPEQRERGIKLVYREAQDTQKREGKLNQNMEQILGYIVHKLKGEENKQE